MAENKIQKALEEYENRVNARIEKEKSKLEKVEELKKKYYNLMSWTDAKIKFCNRYNFNEPSDVYYEYNGIGFWKPSQPDSILEVADSLDPALKQDPAFIEIKRLYRRGNKLFVKNLTYRMEERYESRDFHDGFTRNLEYITWGFLERDLTEEEYNAILDGTHPSFLEAKEVEHELEVICRDYFGAIKPHEMIERNLVPC